MVPRRAGDPGQIPVTDGQVRLAWMPLLRPGRTLLFDPRDRS